MKKKIFYLLVTLMITINVYAASAKFKFDGSDIFKGKSKSQKLALEFEQSYNIDSNEKEQEQETLKDLAKQTTYYLLGPANNINETSESYIKRKNDFYSLRYAPEIPLNADGTLNSNTQEYTDELFTGIVIPNMFVIVNDLEIIYEQYNDVNIVSVKDGFYARVSLKNVELKIADEETPMKYKKIVVDLDMYYYFKEYKGTYKLYYLYGEYDESLKQYNEEAVQNEYRGISNINEYKSGLSSLYNYDKLNSITDKKINSIYNANKNNILMFNTVDGQNISNAATGFLINENIAITTWSYLEKSLVHGSYITVKDGNNHLLEIEGIITIDIDNDYALLKISNAKGNGVKIGELPNVEDGLIMISTKTGSKLSSNIGIVMSVNNNITSLIPTVEYEEGAPVFNENGQVVGMNSSKIVNSYFSESYGSEMLNLIKERFETISPNDISYITFEELKDNYYIKYGTDNVVNNISSDVWNKYKQIGNLEQTINLELIKANYKKGILSLRYKNSLSSVFENMQLASAFIGELKNNGYIEITNEEMKKVYKNKDYRITIMSEFDYLIIVIAEN